VLGDDELFRPAVVRGVRVCRALITGSGRRLSERSYLEKAMTTIGFLSPTIAPTQAAPNAALEAFRQGLVDLGYVDGRDFTIAARWGAGRDDQLPVLAAELVHQTVDILVGIGGMASRAAKGATTTIPIVSAVVIDPRDDLVANLDRPGGNITGVTTFDPQEPRKKLELLTELVPGLARIAFLGDKASPSRVLKNHEDQPASWAYNHKV
jgi:putative tryptophan/tyrosine transport system substrate-binding protein